MDLNYKKAINKLLAGSDESCQQFFIENNKLLEQAYYNLLHGRHVEAYEIFSQIEQEDIRAHWGKFLSLLVIKKIETYPSYFELRNFLEIDFNLLLENARGEYIENILSYTAWLSSINPEVNKYIGRVFIKNGYDKFGIFYLEEAKRVFFNDPELHYLLAEYYYRLHDFNNAMYALNCCLEILPEYYPALTLKKKIKL